MFIVKIKDVRNDRWKGENSGLAEEWEIKKIEEMSSCWWETQAVVGLQPEEMAEKVGAGRKRKADGVDVLGFSRL